MAQLQRVAIDTASGTATLIAAVASKRIKVYDMFFALASAVTVNLKSDTTSLTGTMTLAASVLHRFGPIDLTGADPIPSKCVPVFVCAAGEALVLVQSGTAQVSGQIIYSQE